MELRVRTLPNELKLPPQFEVPSPPQYFKLPTTMAAVGPRGRGKTYNLCLWNKWMFDNEFFTRFYVISPTYESNDPLKTIPTRPGDVYTNNDESVEALRNIVTKVESEAHWHKEIITTYTEHYTEYRSHKRDISKMERAKVSYLRKMQKKIEDYYKDLEEEHEQMSIKSKAIEYVLRHKKEPPLKEQKRFINISDPLLVETEEDKTNRADLHNSRHKEKHPWFHPPPQLQHPVPLLFIDDCSHSPIYSTSRSNPLVNLTLRHRHLGGQGYGVSLQFAVQTFKSGVPKALRANTMQFLIFKTNDLSTILDIYQEVGAYCTKPDFVSLYFQAIQDPHDFLLIDTNPKDEMRVFRRGFDTFLIMPESKSTKRPMEDLLSEEDDYEEKKQKMEHK